MLAVAVGLLSLALTVASSAASGSFVHSLSRSTAAVAPGHLSAPDCKRHPALTPVACGCDKLVAPAHFNLTFHATMGDFTVRVTRSDAPIGADRLYAMSICGDYLGASAERGNEGSFFRVVPQFVVQWGIGGLPAVSGAWENLVLDNDAPNKLSNTRGTLSYAAEQDAAGQACNRTTQLFINYADNSRLDALGFTVVGTVSEQDMAALDRVVARWGQEPDQDLIYSQGNAYLAKSFPGLSYTNSTSVSK